ncbi:MAG TPA: DUF6457 domain-containing protein [Candidatus Limnocylindria bacterium]
MTLAEWLDRLRTELGDDPGLTLSPEEERLLLDLARLAAHSSERIAAPLTTFLAGVALADAPSPDREERLRSMVDALS